ncbi:DUF4136 domain-containing protein [Larkinella sp. VNQ87]|uniref:DUF4136 domain-containing protein n=1 Tax=Larkinella sp. VNQ87 TaxID=3400921 RepID=UPI003BFD7270
MKKLIIATAFALVAGLTQAQNITVDADKKLNTDFSKYKTYAWASQVDSKLDEGFYFLNDLVLKDRIRNAVKFAMDGRGYTYTRTSPDLLVNFRVFEKPVTIRGYTGYGTTYFGTKEVREPEDVTTFEVKAGSVVVNLVDTKTGQVVWRGLASGLTNANGFDRSDNKIKEAVNLIFEKYPYRADQYSSSR